MSNLGVESFLNLLELSGLLSESEVQAEVAALRAKTQQQELVLEPLTQHLLDRCLITSWHLDKLLSGKYKGFLLGKYKLLGHLGTGGMSSVYLAEHRLSKQRRAIKVLPRKRVADKSYLDRFYLEARAAASLNHPNIVRIYDICNEGDTHYMVMEYVQGKDLYDLVKSQGPLSFNQAVDFCAQAAEGLAHAHKRDLVHRDIKPANLLLTPEGVVKILDLGLALVNQDDSESLTLLYNERVMGTADYLSPEQAVNSHNVDSRADIYSLGCTLYFLLTGHPPFPSGTLAQRIASHQNKEPADLRSSRADCPASLVGICQQMMRKKPDHRYPSCIDLKSDLLGWLETGRQLGKGLLPGTLASEQLDSEQDSLEDSTVPPIVIDTSLAGTSSKSSKSARSSKKTKSSKFLNSSNPASSDMPNQGSAKRANSLSSKKMRSSGSHKLGMGAQNKTLGVKAANWILPLAIVLMFILLLVILYFVSKILIVDEEAVSRRIKGPATHAALAAEDSI